jgi:hypothetical protein
MIHKSVSGCIYDVPITLVLREPGRYTGRDLAVQLRFVTVPISARQWHTPPRPRGAGRRALVCQVHLQIGQTASALHR